MMTAATSQIDQATTAGGILLVLAIALPTVGTCSR
jgi:hypothetical protein